MRRPVAEALAAAGVTAAALVVLWNGHGLTIQVENTQDAVRAARHGRDLVLLASGMSLLAAWGVHRAGGAVWAAVAVASPAVTGGGLVLVTTQDSLVPLVASMPATVAAAVGAVAGVVRVSRRALRERRESPEVLDQK